VIPSSVETSSPASLACTSPGNCVVVGAYSRGQPSMPGASQPIGIGRGHLNWPQCGRLNWPHLRPIGC
jgi:hypothetical protein